MKLPIFTTVVVLSALSWLYMKRSGRKMKDAEDQFWEREREANSTRRKPLTDLDYITIPYESLPITGEIGNPVIMECEEFLLRLKDAKIVNLNGISNTDLKLRYGVANLNDLSEYDQNYTELIRALADWGEELQKTGKTDDAVKVLEFGISCHTDIRKNYVILADIYAERKDYDEIERLIGEAEQLTSLTKNGILNELKKRSIFSPSYR
ncbi:MAG: hypothetical protein J6Y57_00890 [Lachnospiraceae bacterium]|nr:hypothetical protein [Lachnospiraceae bacterium]